MLRLGSGALWGSGCLRAERAIWGGRRCRSRRRERNISRAGLPSRLSRCGRPRVRSTRRTCKPTPARNSMSACSNALSRRSAKPGRAITSRPARAPREPSTLPKYVAGAELDPLHRQRTLDREQHSSVRNIGGGYVARNIWRPNASPGPGGASGDLVGLLTPALLLCQERRHGLERSSLRTDEDQHSGQTAACGWMAEAGGSPPKRAAVARTVATAKRLQLCERCG